MGVWAREWPRLARKGVVYGEGIRIGAALQEVGGDGDGGNVSMSGTQRTAEKGGGGAAHLGGRAASDRPRQRAQQMSGWLLGWCGGPLLLRMWCREPRCMAACLVRKNTPRRVLTSSTLRHGARAATMTTSTS